MMRLKGRVLEVRPKDGYTVLIVGDEEEFTKYNVMVNDKCKAVSVGESVEVRVTGLVRFRNGGAALKGLIV